MAYWRPSSVRVRYHQTPSRKGTETSVCLMCAEHLLVEVVAQAGQRSHPGLGVGVFGLQVRGDLGVLFVAQPGVVVAEDHAMQSGFSVLLAGNGGAGELASQSFPSQCIELGHPHPAMEPLALRTAYNEER